MRDVAQVFFKLIDLTPTRVIFFFSFTEPFLHVFLLYIHSNEVLITVLCSLDDDFYFIFVLLQLFGVGSHTLSTLIHRLLLEANFLLHALYSILLLMEEDVLL